MSNYDSRELWPKQSQCQLGQNLKCFLTTIKVRGKFGYQDDETQREETQNKNHRFNFVLWLGI